MAFGAHDFQPYNAASFVTNAALNWFVYDRVPTGAVVGLHSLGAHTDVYFLTCGMKGGSSKVATKRLTWSHPVNRPFGNPSPIQCPECKSLRQWEVEWGFDENRQVTSFKLSCRGNKEKCKYVFVVNKPEGLRLSFGTDHAREGSWYEELVV
jgi:hypothetical protein